MHRILILLATLACAGTPAAAAPSGLVVIVCDDLGWRDLGCTGSDFHETPNLDAFAASGVRCTAAYAACPVCSPTRASLLTGRFPARTKVTNFIGKPAVGRLIEPANADALPPAELTYAEVLRDAGWQTWHVGKWHLGEAGPRAQGFATSVLGGHQGSPPGYFRPWRGLPDQPAGPAGQHLGDACTDAAIALLRARDRSKPFLLNLWFYDPHTPLQAKPELIAKYRDKAARLGRDPARDVVVGEPFPIEHKRAQRVQRRQRHGDPVYAAMVETIDANIGRLLAALQETGAGDAVVVFTSDNGGLSTAEGSPTSNAPLREGKGWLTEGGLRVPLLVRAPGLPGGGTCASPIVSYDLFPSLLAWAGVAAPAGERDGRAMQAALAGEAVAPRPLLWHFPHYGNQGGRPGGVARDGDLKLIEDYESGGAALFALASDPGEAEDLAASRPAEVARLRALLAAHRAATGAVMPTVNAQWKP